MANGGAIEIVTVDPNADGYDTDSEDEDSEDEDDDDDDDDDEEDNETANNALLNFEQLSQCSNATFRTRTDSSSIGDYESHTSDYDDDDDDDDDDEEDNEDGDINNFVHNSSLLQNVMTSHMVANNVNSSLLDVSANLIVADDLLLDTNYLKNRTLSTNTINSDVDGLGLQIDANNFDLAEFITKDDFQIHNAELTTNITTETKSNLVSNDSIVQSPAVVQFMSSKHSDSDSDSDVIVDVETVEVDEDEASSLRKASEILKPSCSLVQTQAEEDVTYVDNIKSDPSWSPTQTAKKLDNIKMEVSIYILFY